LRPMAKAHRSLASVRTPGGRRLILLAIGLVLHRLLRLVFIRLLLSLLLYNGALMMASGLLVPILTPARKGRRGIRGHLGSRKGARRQCGKHDL
jgi:hypothetical protein